MREFESVFMFIGILAAFIVLTLLLGMRERKRSRGKRLRALREGFGKPSRKTMHQDRYDRVPQYDLHHPGSFRIDEITWNDLDLDRLFHAMDSTCSAAGEEYLYHLLRSPAMSPEDLPFSQAQYAFFADRAHEEQRLCLQEILADLGHAGKYSLYDSIDAASALGKRSNVPHYAAAAAPFAAFGLMFWNTGIGLVLLLVVFAFNLRTYFKEKAEIAPYFQVFTYILRLLHCAEALERQHCPAFEEETAQIPALLQAFRGFRRGTGILLGSASGGADPFGIILEYVRILFHIDLMKFNSMLGQLQGRQEEIDRLLTVTGRIDACISLVSWRETLPHAAVPDLEGKTWCAEGLYHPLLAEPVVNDLEASRPVLLTGSNASGKSTFLKAAALCALLSQAVGIAPANAYRGHCFRIYTSMALRDSLQDGESYFIVEIKSLRRILEAARTGQTAPVLCCIDEVLRGTNTVERIAASAEILRRFAMSGTLCFAATHDLELTGLLGDVFDNMHFSEEIVDGDVRFSYLLQPGPSDSCNAIALLSSLGYDRTIVEKAQERADRFLQEGTWR